MNKKKSLLMVWTGGTLPSYQYWMDAMGKYYDAECLTPPKWVHGSVESYAKDQKLSFKLITTVFWPYLSSNYIVPQMFIRLLIRRYDLLYFINELDRANTFFHLVFCLIFSPRTKRFTYSLQNLPEPHYYKWRHKFFLNLNKNIVHGIVCASGEVAGVLNYHRVLKPMLESPLGVSSKFFFPGNKKALKIKYGLSEMKTIILYAGSLHKAKGIQYIINAVFSNHQNLNLLLAGDGPLVEAIPKNANIRYLGKLNQEQLKEMYQLSDYIILPSIGNNKWKEQIGRVLLEGILCGCVAIGSHSGYIPQIVERAEALFEPEEPEDLNSFLSKLPLHNHNEIQAEQRKKVLETFSWETQGKKTFQFFENH